MEAVGHSIAQECQFFPGAEREQGSTGDHQRMLHNAQVLHAGSEMQGLDGEDQGL